MYTFKCVHNTADSLTSIAFAYHNIAYRYEVFLSSNVEFETPVVVVDVQSLSDQWLDC